MRQIAVHPQRAVELTLVALYQQQWTTAEEISLLESGSWHPRVEDFEAVANTPNQTGKRTEVVRVVTFKDMVGAIQAGHPEGTIARVNILTHGAPSVVSLSGKLERDGECLLGSSASDPREDKRIDMRTLEWLNNDTTWGRPYREVVRQKLAPKAEIWLVCCNAGLRGAVLGAELASEMAKTFNATVRYYRQEICFWPDYQDGRITARNCTSIGRSSTGGKPEGSEAARLGRGYCCWVTVPPELAGKHLERADRKEPVEPYE